MTYQRNILADYHELKKPEKVGLGDGRTVDAIWCWKGIHPSQEHFL